jgi:hypothetical protein
MIRILTSDVAIRFFCGFGIGCIGVFAGANGLFGAAF